MKGNESIAALDLGSSSVTLMVASKGEGDRLHVEGLASVPSGGIINGEIHNLEQVSKSITAAVEELRLKTGITVSDVFTGISGRHIRSTQESHFVYANNGEISQEDLRRLTESMQNMPAPKGMKSMNMSAQSYLVDDRKEVSNPVGEFGDKLGGTFNFVLAESEYISRIEKAMQRVGLQQKRMFVNALAAAWAVALPDEKELGVAVVEIGAGTTDVCIWLGGTVRYVGVIPMGADAINKDIRAYGILERHVETLKINYGSATPESESSEKKIRVSGRTPHDEKAIPFQTLASIIEARMKDIADYVMDEIRSSGYDGRLGMGLVITGGGAGLKNIDAFFRNYTSMEVRVASPDVMVDNESKEMVADYSLATVVGLLVEAMALGSGARGGVTVTKTTVQRRQEPGPDRKNGPDRDTEDDDAGTIQPPPDNKKPDDDSDNKRGKGRLGRWFDSVFSTADEDIV